MHVRHVAGQADIHVSRRQLKWRSRLIEYIGSTCMLGQVGVWTCNRDHCLTLSTWNHTSSGHACLIKSSFSCYVPGSLILWARWLLDQIHPYWVLLCLYPCNWWVPTIESQIRLVLQLLTIFSGGMNRKVKSDWHDDWGVLIHDWSSKRQIPKIWRMLDGDDWWEWDLWESRGLTIWAKEEYHADENELMLRTWDGWIASVFHPLWLFQTNLLDALIQRKSGSRYIHIVQSGTLTRHPDELAPIFLHHCITLVTGYG